MLDDQDCIFVQFNIFGPKEALQDDAFRIAGQNLLTSPPQSSHPIVRGNPFPVKAKRT